MAKEPNKKIVSKLEKLVSLDETKPIEKKKPNINKVRDKLNAKFNFGEKNQIRIAAEKPPINVIPTNVIRVDHGLRIGGLPRGRITMIYGSESSWKSTLTLKAIAQAQQMGLTAAYVDPERTFENSWAMAHGVDVNDLLYVQPDTQEEGLDVLTELILNDIGIIVLDSLVAMASSKEMYDSKKAGQTASISTEAMGLFPRKLSQWLRANNGRIADHDVCFIVINQLRDNISGYGNATSVPGGKAIRFYDSIELGMKKLTAQADRIVDKKNNEIGAKYQFKVGKNKLGQPGNEGIFTAYGSLVDNVNSILDIAVDEGYIVRPNNTRYEFEGSSWIGREKMRNALITDKGLYASVENMVRENLIKNQKNYDPYNIEPDEEPPEDIEIFNETDATGEGEGFPNE